MMSNQNLMKMLVLNRIHFDALKLKLFWFWKACAKTESSHDPFYFTRIHSYLYWIRFISISITELFKNFRNESNRFDSFLLHLQAFYQSAPKVLSRVLVRFRVSSANHHVPMLFYRLSLSHNSHAYALCSSLYQLVSLQISIEFTKFERCHGKWVI